MVIPELIHMKIWLLCLGTLYLVISLCEMMCDHKESIHNTLQGSVVDTMKVSKNIFSARYFQLSLQVKKHMIEWHTVHKIYRWCQYYMVLIP